MWYIATGLYDDCIMHTIIPLVTLSIPHKQLPKYGETSSGSDFLKKKVGIFFDLILWHANMTFALAFPPNQI